jgi:hypothetical protein
MRTNTVRLQAAILTHSAPLSPSSPTSSDSRDGAEISGGQRGAGGWLARAFTGAFGPSSPSVKPASSFKPSRFSRQKSSKIQAEDDLETYQKSW